MFFCRLFNYNLGTKTLSPEFIALFSMGTTPFLLKQNSFNMGNFLPTGGLGLRYLIFPQKDIYTRIDIAFTREGNGVYFFIGEAF